MKARLIAIAAAVAVGIALSASASAECIYPKAPDSAPNGSTATEPEMIAGMQAFKKYDAEVNAYLSCLDLEANTRITAAADNADKVKQIKEMSAKKHNAAIDELQVHADEFNSQLRAYKTKKKS
jgi:fumarate hydratase class II